MQPLVSVIIPTYNRQYCLARAISSVISQTYRNIELIIVDDGSTDSTYVWLKKNFPEIQVLQQANSGVSKARNNGAGYARGSWLAFLDSDDAWKPEKISCQISSLLKQPKYSICHTNEVWIRHGKRVNPGKKHEKKGGWIFQECLGLCLISPSSVIIKRELFLELDGFNESFLACEDYDFWLKITAKEPVLYLSKPLTIKYGGHPDQLSKKYWGMDRFRIKALQNAIDTLPLSPENCSAAIDTFCKKINVYLTGAKKRKKYLEIKYYEELLKKY